MSIKWTKKDVLQSFAEALNPPGVAPGDGKMPLSDMLAQMGKAGMNQPPTTPPQVE